MIPGDQRRARLRVTVSDERGRAMPYALAGWLARVAPASASGSVNVALVSDRLAQTLNCQYRGRDYATDVLSFPVGEPAKGATGRSRRPSDLLGEIVIARGVARRQARRAGHSETTELRVLALHGLLHLLGYDHETDRGAMARLERTLGRKGGLPAGLIERP
jgi:probable rRNA maturation factor